MIFNKFLNRKFASVALSVIVSFLFVYALVTSTTTISSTGINTTGDFVATGNLTALTLGVSATTTLSATTTINGVTYVWPISLGSNGQVLGSDGTGNLVWTSSAGGATFVGTSSASHNGNFSYGGNSGYVAGNAICNASYAGSHFCSTGEILNTIVSGNISTFSGTAWIAEGPPGYTSNSNDCSGYTSSDSSYLGAFWEMISATGGKGWLTNCSQTKPLACCS